MSHPTRLRPYRQHRLYAVGPPPPDVQAAMDELRRELVADKGGLENMSTAERILVDLAVAAAVKSQRVEAYLATMPSLVDKRHRKVWTVVRDSTQLAGHLASLLRDLGLERRARPVDLAVQLAGPPARVESDEITDRDENAAHSNGNGHSTHAPT